MLRLISPFGPLKTLVFDFGFTTEGKWRWTKSSRVFPSTKLDIFKSANMPLPNAIRSQWALKCVGSSSRALSTTADKPLIPRRAMMYGKLIHG